MSRSCPFGTSVATLTAGRAAARRSRYSPKLASARDRVEAVNVAGGERGIADRSAAVTAIADDFGGDALHQRGDRARIDQQRVVGVAVDVDEAGGDNKAGGVDGCFRFPSMRRSGDAAVLDADIGAARRGAGAVDQGAVRIRRSSAILEPSSQLAAAGRIGAQMRLGLGRLILRLSGFATP